MDFPETVAGINGDATPTERIVAACRDIDWTAVPDAEREHAVVLVQDFFGVLLGSTDAVESSQMAREYAETYGGGPATVVGDADGAPPAMAAFANGAVSHGIELDDTHSGSSTHPGSVIIPTALAVAEREHSSGLAFLDAVVAGYELMTRVGRAGHPAALYDRGFHPTAVTGVFGAALAAAKLRELDLGETVNAVGIAGSFAAGNLEYLADGTLSKRIQPGIAAQAGVTAAALAARGYTGPRTILEGENGFLDGYSDGASVDRLFATQDDGVEFEIARTGIKPHACCRYNQTPIDAVLAIAEEHDVAPADVASITVGVVDAALGIVAEPRDEKVRPRTSTDAQFSLPYSVAIALVEGQAFFEQYREPFLSDERVLALADRVHVEHDPSLDEAYPDKWGARVEVTTEAGETYASTFENCLGDPGNMPSRDALAGKVHTLAERQLDAGAVDDLLAMIEDLTDAESVDELASLIAR
jgi:2-methylcitrate dehydratase PrpD